MATTKIRSSSILDGQVANADLSATVAVTGGQIADDAVTLAKMAGGTDGNLITYDASGDPAYVATGAATNVLTSNGAGAAPTFQAPAAGGLTAASQWRLTADFTGDAAPIASNLEEADAPVGFGVLGSSMIESSGIFTFPSTGYWLIKFFGMWLANTSSLYNKITIQTTTNDSTYAIATDGSTGAAQLSNIEGAVVEYIFDVTDTANCKCRFHVDVYNAGMTTMGNTDQNETYMSFLRLADT
jgi:hypothetical protein